MATLQELIDLTPSQEKAWKRFEKAAKDFTAAGGKFYTVLDTVNGYNGEHIEDIENDAGNNTQSVSMPYISYAGLAGFADDSHGFVLKGGVEVEE